MPKKREQSARSKPLIIGHIYNSGVLSSQKYQKAIDYLNEAQKLQPECTNYADYYAVRADCYIMLEQYEKAAAHCSVALKLDPQYAYVYNTRSTAYRHLGNTQLANKDQKKYGQLSMSFALSKR